jgi:hypothetical protein
MMIKNYQPHSKNIHNFFNVNFFIFFNSKKIVLEFQSFMKFLPHTNDL